MLEKIDLSKRVAKDTYKKGMEEAGEKLGLLQRELKAAGIPVIVVFEGMGAAGKGVQINRLIQALDADFKGYEDVQAMCLAAPKYGNDDERADFCVGEIFTHVVDQFEKYDTKFGKMTCGMLPRVGQHPDRTVGGRTALRAQREDAADRRHRSHRRHGCEWPDGTLKIRQPHPPRAFHPGHAAQHEV